MTCGLNIPLAPRWIELPGDPEPLREELAARRVRETFAVAPEPPEEDQ